MSRPTTNPERLVQLLDKYVEEFDKGTSDTKVLEEICRRLPTIDDPNEFRSIAENLWDKYFPVDVEVMIAVLRRWLEIDSQSGEARRVLGTYLLAHGPDWDDEGHRLLGQAQSNGD